MSARVTEHALRALDQSVRGRDRERVEQLRGNVRAFLFDKQLRVLEDPSRLIAVRCGRRAGKSIFGGAALVDAALARRESVSYYITQRRTRAKDLMWDSPQTGLKKIDKVIGVGMKFHDTDLIAKVPQTQSMIRLFGAETRADIDKLRGEPFAIAILDEVRNFPPKLAEILIRDVLIPSAMDFGGQIYMTSNPGNILAGPFYEATKPGTKLGIEYGSDRWKAADWEEKNRYSWSTHYWNASHNSAAPQIWHEMLAYKAAMGWSDTNPHWLREYLGEWSSDDTGFVFRFDPERNTYEPDPTTPYGLPVGHKWEFLCGMDFGVVDEFALVVVATAPTSPKLYEVYTHTKSYMTAREIAELYLQTERTYGGFSAVVGDAGGLGAAFFQELAVEHKIYIERAEKRDKLDYIELLNSDLHEGNVLVRKDSVLAEEMPLLQWSDEEKRKTVKGQKDHAVDGLTYIWRHARHRDGVRFENIPKRGSAEAFTREADAYRESLLKRSKQSREYDGESLLEKSLDNAPTLSSFWGSEWD